MLETFMRRLLERVKNEQHIVIVGAGKNGKTLLKRLIDEGSAVDCFMDNDKKLHGKSIDGVTVSPIMKLENPDGLYLISVGEKYRKEIYNQLLQIGIPENYIIKCYLWREYEYMKNLPEKFYKEEVMEMYREGVHKVMNYDHPSTYNEIISWEKINMHDSLRTRLADKYLVRDWIREKIGENYLTKLYGVWDDPADIDFSSLPYQFVLKLNHSSGCNIIVKDKSEIEIGAIIKRLQKWKSFNYAYHALEMHYRDIVPKVICEEYLDGVADELYEYKIYCFHGIPVYINCLIENTKLSRRSSYYNLKWEKLPFSYGDPFDECDVPRPNGLENMLEVTKILCKGFRHVRVDWYILKDDRLVFGEMTFTPWAGRHPFIPNEYDAVFGSYILNSKGNF